MYLQPTSQLHRPDRVSLHVAILLAAYLLWSNANHCQCHYPQWYGGHWQDQGQGELTYTNTFIPYTTTCIKG